MSNEELRRRVDESERAYCHRITMMKTELGLTWRQICDILNNELGLSLTPDGYIWREKHYDEKAEYSSSYTAKTEDDMITDLNEAILEYKKERLKLADERSTNNAIIRRMSREETIKEIAFETAKSFNSRILLEKPKQLTFNDSECEGILLLGDWHYGIEVDNYWNHYNTNIAKMRLDILYNETLKRLDLHKVKHLHIVNLGDLISGRIHQQIRLSNRIDVITQIMEVSEMVAEFVNDLSHHCTIDYYDTGDNHSRIEPNLKDSLELESLCRITTWFLRTRLEGNKNVEIHYNQIADDIVNFNVFNHNVVAVHGDKDKPSKVIENLTLLSRQPFDLVLTAHLHHVASDEKCFARQVENGSLMGTDDYAFNLRKVSKPSQTLIIADKHNPLYCQYIIDLD